MRILENVIKRVLNEYSNHPMMLKESVSVSDQLKYHLDKKIPLCENVFKIYFSSREKDIVRLFIQNFIPKINL